MTQIWRLSMAVVVLLGGCSDDGSKEKKADLNAYCGAICARQDQCVGVTEQGACPDGCKTQMTPLADKLSGRFMAALQECLVAKECASWLNGEVMSACVAEVTASLSPTAAGAEFCSALDGTTGRCGLLWERALCLDLSKQYSDAALNEARSCASKACEEMNTCLEGALASKGQGPDSCPSSFDGYCDEPDLCPSGTDTTDCG